MQCWAKALLPCYSKHSFCKGKRDREETCPVWRWHRLVSLFKAFRCKRVILYPCNIIPVTAWNMCNTDLFQQTSLFDYYASEFFFQDHIIITRISLAEKPTVWLHDHKRKFRSYTAAACFCACTNLASLHSVFFPPKKSTLLLEKSPSEVEELSKSSWKHFSVRQEYTNGSQGI